MPLVPLHPRPCASLSRCLHSSGDGALKRKALWFGLLLALMGSMLGAVVVLLASGRHADKPVSLAGGRSLRFLGVTFGKRHACSLDRGWRRWVSPILPSTVAARLGIRGRDVLNLNEDACVVWAEDVHPPVGGWRGIPCEIVDQAGNVYRPAQWPMGPPYVFYSYPRQDAQFRVRFGFNWPTGYENLLEREVENRGPRDYPSWNPETLPATRTNRGVKVTLKGFKIHHQPPRHRGFRPRAEPSSGPARRRMGLGRRNGKPSASKSPRLGMAPPPERVRLIQHAPRQL